MFWKYPFCLFIFRVTSPFFFVVFFAKYQFWELLVILFSTPNHHMGYEFSGLWRLNLNDLTDSRKFRGCRLFALHMAWSCVLKPYSTWKKWFEPLLFAACDTQTATMTTPPLTLTPAPAFELNWAFQSRKETAPLLVDHHWWRREWSASSMKCITFYLSSCNYFQSMRLHLLHILLCV